MKNFVKRFSVIIVTFALLLSATLYHNRVVAVEDESGAVMGIPVNEMPEVVPTLPEVEPSPLPEVEPSPLPEAEPELLPEVGDDVVGDEPAEDVKVEDVVWSYSDFSQTVTMRFYGIKEWNGEQYYGFNDIEDFAVRRADGRYLYEFVTNLNIKDEEAYNALLKRNGFDETNLLLDEALLEKMFVLDEVKSYRRVYVYLHQYECAHLTYYNPKAQEDFMEIDPLYGMVGPCDEAYDDVLYFAEHNFVFSPAHQHRLEKLLVGGMDNTEVGYEEPQHTEIYKEIGFENVLLPFDWRAEIYEVRYLAADGISDYYGYADPNREKVVTWEDGTVFDYSEPGMLTVTTADGVKQTYGPWTEYLIKPYYEALYGKSGY